MAKKIVPFHIETKPEIDYRDDKKRVSNNKSRSKSPRIETKPKVVYTEGNKRKIQTWTEYTRGARFRSGIEVTAEMQEGVKEAVQTHFDILAEEEELKRLVREGEKVDRGSPELPPATSTSTSWAARRGAARRRVSSPLYGSRNPKNTARRRSGRPKWVRASDRSRRRTRPSIPRGTTRAADGTP